MPCSRPTVPGASSTSAFGPRSPQIWIWVEGLRSNAASAGARGLRSRHGSWRCRAGHRRGRPLRYPSRHWPARRRVQELRAFPRSEPSFKNPFHSCAARAGAALRCVDRRGFHAALRKADRCVGAARAGADGARRDAARRGGRLRSGRRPGGGRGWFLAPGRPCDGAAQAALPSMRGRWRARLRSMAGPPMPSGLRQ